MKGMTGFGSADFSVGRIKGTVEIKSVNHRYLDLDFYLPGGFGSLENRIRQILNKPLKRGSISFSLKILGKPSTAVHFNHNIVKTYLDQARSLKKEFGLQGDLTVGQIFQMPGVIETKESVLDVNDLWPSVEKAIQKALNDLIGMRKREGKTLSRELANFLSLMSLRIKKIGERSRSILSEKRKILNPEEFVSYQKSSDINEELTRMLHHIDELKALLKSVVPVGKQIDFIAQEMQRETNTIGSKVQDRMVSNGVIALKGKIEKIREQSQNIE